MKGKSMKTSIAIFTIAATAVGALPAGLAVNAAAQVPVYRTTVTYSAGAPVVIQNAPVVPAAPVVGPAPVAGVRQRVYVAPAPAPLYVVPAPAPVYLAPPPPVYAASPVCFTPPVVSLGFGFSGCRPGFAWGIGLGFGPGFCW